jgi:GH35 family endo-1,4-beta-xylanase
MLNIKIINILAVFVTMVSVVVSDAGTLTIEEIAQIENEFGITLTVDEKQKLADIVHPDSSAQWRDDAYARIEQYRKADLAIQVLDTHGVPVHGAQVSVKLKRNDFKFGGALSVDDFSGATDKLNMPLDTYKARMKSMFNSVGTNNGFKPKLPFLHGHLPGLISWGEANNIPVRGHLLIWPGNGQLSDLDDPSKKIGEDYGNHLSHSSTSAYASYNVQGAVEAYKNSARMQTDKNALKAVVDAEIAEWAGNWDVYEWDVINETLDNHLLQDILGEDQMAEWFNVAESNVVSPDCKLAINDYQIISCMSDDLRSGYYDDRRDRYMENIDRILADGGRIDRIGFQSRIRFERRDPQLIYDRLEEWGNRYGLEMVGTEFEVADSGGSWYPYTYTEDERCQITEETITQYFSHPLVTGLTHWNAISNSKNSLVDYDGRPTSHGLVWYYLHQIRFCTDEVLSADVNGDAGIRAFKGEYEITVSYNGNDYVSGLMLSNDQSVVVNLDSTVVENPNTVYIVDSETFLTSPEASTNTFMLTAQKGDVLAVLSASNSGSDPDAGSVSFSGTALDSITYDNNNQWGATASYWYTTVRSNGIVQVDVTTPGSADAYPSFGLYQLRAGSNEEVVFLATASAGSGAALIGNVTNSYDFVGTQAGLCLEAVSSFRTAIPVNTNTVVDITRGSSSRSIAHGIFQASDPYESIWNNSDKSVSLIGLAFGSVPGNSPEAFYALWSGQFDLGDLDTLTDDPDGDLLDNLAEYAMGGDPTNRLDVGYVPEFKFFETGGTNYVEYVYSGRNDAAARGLTYSVETTDDLTDGVWTNSGFAFVGADGAHEEFSTMTNHLPVVDGSGFIRLNIRFAPE